MNGTTRAPGVGTVNRRALLRALKASRVSYLMILPAFLVTVLFCYVPMYGITLAFKNYDMRLGILGSPWANFVHFQRLFEYPDTMRVLVNTLVISLGRIVFEFPFPIVMALLLNEMRQRRFKKLLQTVYTLPHFLSWVIVAGILKNFLRDDGFVNRLIVAMGFESVPFLNREDWFKPLLYITNVWKEMGWSVIIYMATITGIDPALYDAASVDGANRFQRVLYITLPSMTGIILLQLMMALGNVLNAGFDQVFNMTNAITEASGQILDTYIYKITFQQVPNFGFSTAVGLFKGVVNCIFLLSADFLVRRFTGRGLYVE